jgi:hypothetical protein
VTEGEGVREPVDPTRRPAYASSVAIRVDPDPVRGSERLLRYIDRHSVPVIGGTMLAVVVGYLAWSVASVAPVFVPEQVMNRCLAQAQRGTVSTAWELVSPGWNCVGRGVVRDDDDEWRVSHAGARERALSAGNARRTL